MLNKKNSSRKVLGVTRITLLSVFALINNLEQLLKLSSAHKLPGGLFKMQISIQYIWGGIQEFALLTNPQVTLMMPDCTWSSEGLVCFSTGEKSFKMV